MSISLKKIFLIILILIFLKCEIFSEIKLWKVKDVQIFSRFFQENSYLLNKNTWSFYTEKKIHRSKLGAYGIGNGKVFTLLGLNFPLNTFHNLTGPYYVFPFFGDQWIELKISEKTLELPEQFIYQVRDASIVVTKEKGENLELYTVNFAPVSLEAILRIIIVRNCSNEPVNDLKIVCKIFGEKEVKNREIIQKRDTRMLSLGTLSENSYIENGELIIYLGNLGREEEKLSIVYLCVNKSENEKNKTLEIIKNKNLRLLKDTKNYWEKWLSSSLKIISPDQKVNDLIENMKIALKIQRMSNGAQTPVVKYAGRSHDRENVNIVRFLLSCGFYEDVKEIIQFCYKAAIKNKEILNSQDVLTDVSDLGSEPDWEKVPLDNINSHYHAAERPSWTILQFYWYYKHTDDIELIKKCYNYLKRNLLGQEITREYLLPFHGDEMYQITFPFYVAKMPLERMYSADSSFAFVAAAEGMKEIAERLGKSEDSLKFKELAEKVREAIDRYFWDEELSFYAPAILKEGKVKINSPFAEINLKPIWTGYCKDIKKEEKNLYKVMEILQNFDGSIKMAEYADVYHGQIPGLFLYNLAYLDSPYAEKIFNFFEIIADPAGQFAEVHKNSHIPVCINIDRTGFNREDARRFGPWEGSVNAYSIVYYLTGIKPDAQKRELHLLPHLPNSWDRLEVKNCYVGKTPLDFKIFERNFERSYFIKNRGGEEIFLNLTVSLKKCKIKFLKINNKILDVNSFKIEEEKETVRIRDIKLKIPAYSSKEIKVGYE